MLAWATRFTLVLATMLAWSGAALASTPDLLFGQQHAYSVTLRGNGEAVVSARLAITNQTDVAQKSFAFEIPGLTVSEITGYQQRLASTCMDNGYGKPLTNPEDAARPCLRSIEPDYGINSYHSGADYTKLSLKNDDSGKYRVDLPVAIEPGKSTALILTYAGTGYTNKQFAGARSFAFQTIKVATRIESLTVAVDVDADQYLDGGDGKVNYAPAPKPASVAREDAKSAGATQLDAIASRIGSDGAITKTAKNLASGESFTVKGAYADATWKLHPWRLALGVGLAVVAVALLVWLARRQHRLGWSRAATLRHDHDQPSDRRPTASTSPIDAATVLAGFVSALLLALIIWGRTTYARQTYAGDSFSSILTDILVLLSSALVVLGPIVWLAAHRRNWHVAVYVMAWQVAWLVVFLTIHWLTFIPNSSAPQPMPYYGAQDRGAGTTGSKPALE